MKIFLTVFSNVLLTTVIISGCFAVDPGYESNESDFGESTYVWENWTTDSNAANWNFGPWNPEPTIP